MNAAALDIAEISETRRRLVLAGHKIVPAEGKIPRLPGWQKLCAGPDDVPLWESALPTHRNTGVLTARTPAVDIDIRDADAADAVEELLRERFGSRGNLLVRYGQRPKRAVPFRTEAPFKKIFIEFAAPVGPDGKKPRIEVLGDGEQFIVHGIHPDTRQPYAWEGGCLWNTAHEQLPILNEEEAREFVNDAADLLVERFGYQRKQTISERAIDARTATRSDIGGATDPRADIETLRKAMDVIPNNAGWDEWNSMGMALWRATEGSDAGFRLFDDWSRKSSVYDERNTYDRWNGYDRCPPKSIGAGSIFYLANRCQPLWRRDDIGILSGKRPDKKEQPEAKSPSIDPEQEEPVNNAQCVSLTDFWAYMPAHSYIYMPTREPWPGGSVNSRIDPIPLLDWRGLPVLNKKDEQVTLQASQWLDKNQPVEQMAWAPGHPDIVPDRLVSDGGWIERKGVKCLNLYRPPTIKPGDAEKAGPWVDHVRRVYPNDAGHIINWLAFKAQKPEVKINHAIVLGGHQGIGKDTALEPIKHAVGPWNFHEVSPAQMLGRFNGFVKSVILRVSEARDLGDVDRFSFYDHMKVYTAAPPDVIRVDEKHLREHAVFNVCGVILTTNHKGDGIYLPADDRRHYVAWSDLTKDDFTEAYWDGIWSWYERGGIAHVVAYLRGLDLTAFNPKAPPPKTPAFWSIVDAGRSPEDAELADVLDGLGWPNAITLSMLVQGAGGGFGADKGTFAEWLGDRKNRRIVPHRLESCGYVPVRNDADQRDGQWKIQGKRQTVYAKATLTLAEQLRAAGAMTR